MSDALRQYGLPAWEDDERRRQLLAPVTTPQSPTTVAEPPAVGLPDWQTGSEAGAAALERTLLPYSEMIGTILKTSPDANEDLDKIVSSAFLAQRLGIPFPQIFANHDAAAAEYWGRTTPARTARTAISEAWKSASMNVDIGRLAFRQMLGDESPELEQQIADIEAAMPDVETQRRSLPVEALKAAANMFPYMWENWKWTMPKALGAAAGATGIAALTGAEVALPAVFWAWFVRGMALGSSAFTFETEAGLQYRALIRAGAPADIARVVSIAVGAGNAALEQVELFNLPGVKEILRTVKGGIAKEIGQEVVVKGTLAKLAERFVAAGKTPATQALRRLGAGMVAAQTTEPLTEVAQEAVNIVGDAVAAAWSNSTRGTTLPIATREEVAKRLVETYKQTALAMLAMGLPGSLGTSFAQFRRGLTLEQQRIIQKQVAQATPAATAAPKAPETPAARGAAAPVAPSRAAAVPPAAQPPAAQAAGEYRTPEGRLYSEESTVGRTAQGAEAILRFGNPETKERYGYVRYELTPERIYVEEVVNEQGERTREMIVELAARNPGIDIQWDPTDEEGAAIKEALIAENPRGTEAGLQWFTEEEIAPPTPEEPIERRPTVPEALTQETFRRRMIEGFGLKDEEVSPFLVFNSIMARNEGIAVNDWLNKYFEREVVDVGTLRKETAAHGAVAATGFMVEGQRIMPLDVDRAEYVGRVKAVFAALEGADFHHAVHEYFHAVERLALSKEQIAGFETALGKLRENWTVEDIEKLADRFEDYLATGRAPTEGLRAIFEKIAAMLVELVSFVRERPRGTRGLSPELHAAYDRLFADPRSGVAQAAAQAAPAAPAAATTAPVAAVPAEQPAEAAPTQLQRQVEEDLFGQVEAKPIDETPSISAIDLATVVPVELPVDQLTLSKDVPNFKEDANAEGVVEPLQAERYERLGTAPIVVWERLDGRFEVITGRHRLDLARRVGEKTIPSQIVREADGFTAAMAMTFDAEANIRDGQGSVRDYATYFRHSALSEEEASRRGLLGRHKGRAGFAIGRYASDGLYTLYRNRQIGEEKAAAIAAAAPNNEALQAAGIQKAKELSVEELVNYLAILKRQATGLEADQQIDLFGRNESFMVVAATLAKEAAKKQAELRAEQAALKSALRLSVGDRSKIVERYGFKAGDTEGMQRRLADLEQEIAEWSNWTSSAVKQEELRDRAGLGKGSLGLFHIDPVDQKEITKKAIATFGVTKDPFEAAWVTYDGKLLDFSGRHIGKPTPGVRSVLHGDLYVGKANPLGLLTGPRGLDYAHRIREFMQRSGAMRIELSRGYMETIGRPNDKQLAAIEPALPRAGFGRGEVHRLRGGVQVIEPAGNELFIDVKDGQAGTVAGVYLQLPTVARIKAVYDMVQGHTAENPLFARDLGGSFLAHTRGFHGTKAIFSEFDPTFMGEGSGTQWYGWGTYVAESEAVARNYAKHVAGENWVVKMGDHPVTEWSGEDLPAAIRQGIRQRNQAMVIADATFAMRHALTILQDMQEANEKQPGTYGAGILRQYSDEVRRMRTLLERAQSSDPSTWRITQDAKRVLYSVVINPGKRDVWMDWHSAVSDEVVERIRSQARRERIELDPETTRKTPDGANHTGSYLYRAVTGKLGSDRAASQFLDRAGITGTRTLSDYQREGAGRPPYNYAVFDPKKVQIESHLLFHQEGDEKHDPWIYKSERVIREKMKGPMQAPALLKMLLNAGVKPEEMKWTGLDDFLAENRKITPEEISGFLASHKLRLREVLKGHGTISASAAARIDSLRGAAEFARSQVDEIRLDALSLLEAAGVSRVDRIDMVDHIMYGDAIPTPEETLREDFRRAWDIAPTFNWNELNDRWELYTRILVQYEEARALPETVATKWGQYTLPAGSNYSETLLIWEPETQDEADKRWARDFRARINASPELQAEEAELNALSPPITANEAEVDAWNEQVSAFQAKVMQGMTFYTAMPAFRSPHWEELNVIVHVRHDERKDTAGRRVLFLEEIQSDWHEEGRQIGYIPEFLPPPTPEEREELVAAIRAMADYRSDGYYTRREREFIDRQLKRYLGGQPYQQTLRILMGQPYNLNPVAGRGAELAQREMARSRREAEIDNQRLVPPAPFSKTWHEVAMKRMLRWAASRNYQLLAWTTGKQQAERYDLRKVADRLEYSEAHQVLYAYKGGHLVQEYIAEPSALPGLIGKELADRLLATPLVPSMMKPYEVHRLEGDEIQVGGMGMSGFYDKILVDFATKYGKKWGATVQDIKIPMPMPDYDIEPAAYGAEEFVVRRIAEGRGSAQIVGRFDTEEEAAAWVNAQVEIPTETVHAIEITAAMRESVLEGQPLFHPDGQDQAQAMFAGEAHNRLIEEAKLHPSAAEFRAAVEAVGTFEEAPGEDMEEGEKAAWYQRIWDRAHPFVPLTPWRATSDFLELLQAKGNRAFWAWIEEARKQGAVGALPPIMQSLVARLSSGKRPPDAALQAALRQIRRNGRMFRAIYATMMGDKAMQRQLESEQTPGPEPAVLPGVPMPEIEAPESSAEIRAGAADEIADPELAEKIRAGTITEGELAKRERENLENLSQLRKNQAEAVTDERVKLIAKQLREAEREREALRRVRRSKKKLAERITRPPGPSVDFEYAEMMRLIAKKVDPHFRSAKTLYRKEASRVFFEANPEARAALPEATWQKIEAKSLDEWSLSELEELAEQVKEFERMGRFKRGLIVRKEQRYRKDRRALVQATVLRGREPAEAVGAAKPTPLLMRGFLSTMKPDRVMLKLDNGKPGVFTEMLDEYNREWNQAKRDERARQEPILRLMEELKFTSDRLAAKRLSGYTWLGQELDIDGFRYHQGPWKGKRPTLQQVMYWYLGKGNARTYAALTTGNNLPAEIIDKGIAMLTPEARKLADAIGADMETHFPELRRAFIDRFNMDLPGEDHYVPMRRLEVNYKERSTEIAADLIARNGLGKQFVARHPTYERIDVPDYWQTPINTNLVNVWLQSIEETEGFVHLDLPVKRMHSILEDPDTRQAITQVYGAAFNRWLFVFTNNLARPDIYQNLTGLDRLQRTLRQNVVIAYLGFNLVSATKNLVTILPYIADAGPGHLVGAAMQWLGGKATSVAKGELFSNELVRFVKDRSELVRNRSIAAEFDLLKVNYGNLWNEINQKIGRAGMKIFEAIDMASICIGWKAVYDRVLKENGGVESAAAEAADKATIRGQPSGRVQDLAEIYRSADVTRWFTMFTSALNALWNIMGVDVPRAIRNKQFLHATGDITALVLSGVGIAIASGALAEDDPEERKRRLIAGAWSQFLDTIPFIGSEISAMIQGRPTGQGVKFFPAIQGLNLGIRALRENELEKAARALGEAVLFGAGLPVTGPKRLLRALESGEVTDLMGWK